MTSVPSFRHLTSKREPPLIQGRAHTAQVITMFVVFEYPINTSKIAQIKLQYQATVCVPAQHVPAYLFQATIELLGIIRTC